MSPSEAPSGGQAPAAPTPVAEEAARLRALHEARAKAELAEAEALAPGSGAIPPRGALFAALAVVKGLPGPAEAAGGAAVSGADGQAAVSALEALGYSADELFFTLSRPEPTLSSDQRSRRLRRQIEATGAETVLALDREAGEDLAAAFGVPPMKFGREVVVLGRRLIAIDGLEASLMDLNRKRAVWRQMQAARRRGPVY
ncbi:MAG: hypothetical protein AB2L09_13215 [Coriobacteriia bacterium]